jgi:hypothetical protein
MEMASTSYRDHVELVNRGQDHARADRTYGRPVLALKFELGLFENPYTESGRARRALSRRI